MWARHRPDLRLSDTAHALMGLFYGKSEAFLDAKIVEDWFPREEALICLSVRSGFDLLLQESNFPPDSEIIFSGINIADMAHLACRHGYRVRGVPVNPVNLQIDPEEVLKLITPRTKAIVFAHLFGSRVSIAPIALLAKQHDLMLIEDCAQAFAGKSFAGSPEADASLFSFGPIKRATAGGGAVLRVRDHRLRNAMAHKMKSYPMQSRFNYTRRLVWLTILTVLSQHEIYGYFHAALRFVGNPDKIIAKMGSTSKKNKSTARLRQQPCLPQKRFLCHRLSSFTEQKQSAEVGRGAKAALGTALRGEACQHHSYWVLPVTVRDTASAIEELRRNGFDATAYSSLRHISTGDQQADDNNPNDSDRWLDQTLFLSTDPAMPERERLRMLDLLKTRPREQGNHADYPAI